jgi:hypothetical protein
MIIRVNDCTAGIGIIVSELWIIGDAEVARFVINNNIVKIICYRISLSMLLQ